MYVYIHIYACKYGYTDVYIHISSPCVCGALLGLACLAHNAELRNALWSDTLSSAAMALGTRDTALCSLYGAFDSLEVRPLPALDCAWLWLVHAVHVPVCSCLGAWRVCRTVHTSACDAHESCRENACKEDEHRQPICNFARTSVECQKLFLETEGGVTLFSRLNRGVTLY